MNDAAKRRVYRRLSPIYPFTTENLAAYLPLLDLKGKSILTLSASGDQVLNAIYYGAKKVDAFDINLLSGFYSELKMAAVASLSRSEFLSYFRLAPDNPQVFSHLLYAQFSASLSPAARKAFDLFYGVFSGDGRALRESGFFYSRPPVDSCATSYNAYLESSKRYLETRRKLKSVEYRWRAGDIREPDRFLGADDRYDVILLSNLADYAHRFFEGPGYAEQFAWKIIRPLSTHLGEGGLICAACLFAVDDEIAGRQANDFYRAEKRRAALSLPGLSYEEIPFEGAIAGHRDLLVVLKSIPGESQAQTQT